MKHFTVVHVIHGENGPLTHTTIGEDLTRQEADELIEWYRERYMYMPENRFHVELSD